VGLSKGSRRGGCAGGRSGAGSVGRCMVGSCQVVEGKSLGAGKGEFRLIKSKAQRLINERARKRIREAYICKYKLVLLCFDCHADVGPCLGEGCEESKDGKSVI
jgi:hypothetical protein